MKRDYELEATFINYLASLDFEDARNAAIPVFEIIQSAEEDFSDCDFDDRDY